MPKGNSIFGVAFSFYYVTFSPSRSFRCETKKLQTRYNKGVQANCKAKGEKYGTKGS